jgi:GR25 family glycosyltransferase involved in LPS biosynthesis
MKIGFDRVYCISYCRNIEKQNNISKVMKYLGINFEFIYGADYTNLKILKHDDFNFLNKSKEKEQQSKNNFKYYTHWIGASYDHYTAVIHAYESGANSVLIMEDDCAFINDISYIQYALNNYPKDADIVKFGYVSRCSLENFKSNIDLYKPNQFIIENVNHIGYIGSQLYGICNRETMKKYIDLQQNIFRCIDCIPNTLNHMYNTNNYGLIYPLSIDKIGRLRDIDVGYPDIYTLLENLDIKKKKKFIFF